MTPMTPMTGGLFLSSLRERGDIIAIIISIMINRIIKDSYLKKINYPTVIGVIVIAVIGGCNLSRSGSISLCTDPGL